MTKTTKQLVILFCTFILFNSILEAQTDWSKTIVYFNKRNAYPQRTEKTLKVTIIGQNVGMKNLIRIQ